MHTSTTATIANKSTDHTSSPTYKIMLPLLHYSLKPWAQCPTQFNSTQMAEVSQAESGQVLWSRPKTTQRKVLKLTKLHNYCRLLLMEKMQFFLHYMLYGLQTKAVCDATKNGSCRVVYEWWSRCTAGGRAVSPTRRAFTRNQMTQNLDDYCCSAVRNNEGQFSVNNDCIHTGSNDAEFRWLLLLCGAE